MGITGTKIAELRQAVKAESQLVRDAVEEVIYFCRLGLPVPHDIQRIINTWEAGQLAANKYGKLP